MKKIVTNYTLLEKCAVFLFFAYVSIFFFRPVETGDIWWHLSTARWLWEHHYFPTVDVFSPTIEKSPWMMTQWLGSCLYYSVYQLGYLVGLKIFRSFLFVLVIGIYFVRARKHIPLVILLLLLWAAVQGFSLRALLRPTTFNLIFLQIYFLILFRHQRETGNKSVYLILLMAAIWSNIHLGCFVYGLPLVGIFFLHSLVQFLVFRRQDLQKALFYKEKVRDLIIILSLYSFSFIISPYGWRAVVYPFMAIFSKDFIVQKILLSRIAELHAPLLMPSWANAWFYILLGCSIFAVFKAKKDKFLLIVLFVSSLFYFLYFRRALTVFVITSLYVFWESMRDSNLYKRWGSQTVLVLTERIIIFVMAMVFLMQTIRLFNSTIILKNDVKMKSWQVGITPLMPVGLVKALKENKIHGVVFNSDIFGGYLLWEAFPQLKPLCDTRQADMSNLLAYIAARRSPPAVWPQIEKKYDISIVLLGGHLKGTDALIRYLIYQKKWQLVGIEGSSMLFVKRGMYTLPPQMENFEKLLQDLESRPLTKSDFIRPQKEFSFGRFLKAYLFPPPMYIQEFQEGLLLFVFGFKTAGLHKMLSVQKDWPSPFINYLFLKAAQDYFQKAKGK